jgi:hypothetical protein
VTVLTREEVTEKAEKEAEAAKARVAQLTEALKDELAAAQRVRAALSTSDSSWLNTVRREAVDLYRRRRVLHQDTSRGREVIEFDEPEAWLTEKLAEARKEERAKCDDEWNLAVAFQSQPKPPGYAEVVADHDARVRAAAIEDVAKMLEGPDWQHYAAVGTNGGLVAAVRALASTPEHAPTANFDIFIGPCVHGRDPYTRCDTCGELTPEEAKKRATRAKCGARCGGEVCECNLDTCGSGVAPKTCATCAGAKIVPKEEGIPFGDYVPCPDCSKHPIADAFEAKEGPVGVQPEGDPERGGP